MKLYIYFKVEGQWNSVPLWGLGQSPNAYPFRPSHTLHG